MVDYQTIAELVSQIPMDTWNLLREIKQRRPAMMLSELIDFTPSIWSAAPTGKFCQERIRATGSPTTISLFVIFPTLD